MGEMLIIVMYTPALSTLITPQYLVIPGPQSAHGRHKRRAEETNFRLDLLCEIVMQLRFEDKAEAMLMRVKAAVAAPPPPPPRPRTEERVKQRKQIIFM